MDLLDTAARAGAIALMAVLGVVLLRDLPRTAVAWGASALLASVAAHLVLSSPDFVTLGSADVLLLAAASAAPAAFWVFSRALFDDESPVQRRDIATLPVLMAIGVARGTGLAIEIVYYLAAVYLAVGALARVAVGFRSDLVEPRRRLRAVLTLAVGVELVAVLIVEVVLAGAQPPRLLDLSKSVTAFGLSALFTGWLLTSRRELLLGEPRQPDASPRAVLPELSADERYRERLLALMSSDKLYRREGLTVGSLATQLDLPEYRLRRIINQQLGYRNFNTFLNEFRIDEACRLLADPGQERLPILNLALDLGYGSIGPFNRAFRTRTGQTPTAYRRSRLGDPQQPESLAGS